ncbi:MAG: c-type cytochrome [Methyloligellaceae bacterium]
MLGICSRTGIFTASFAAATCLSLAVAATASAGKFGFGSAPTAQEIAAIDIDAMPDGRGLPGGSGTSGKGKAVYAEKCAACHGENLEGVKDAGGAALIGGRGSIGTPKTKKTVESYWPYATTLFDYTKRAMPFNAPGSLSNDDIYAVSAYILHRAKIIGEKDVMDAKSLPAVKMPNRDGFISDPRPDVLNYR